MEKSKNSPGIYVPPPLVYLTFFVLSLILQRFFPLSSSFFRSSASFILGIVLIAIGFFLNIPALIQFFKSKNTLVTIKPATSLVTMGIYAFSRNPMYMSLLLIYSGACFLWGNWWSLILLPVLAVAVTLFIIKLEERYLERTFGENYRHYKSKVRRWI